MALRWHPVYCTSAGFQTVCVTAHTSSKVASLSASEEAGLQWSVGRRTAV